MVNILKKFATDYLIDKAHKLLFDQLGFDSPLFPYKGFFQDITNKVQGKMAIQDVYSEVCMSSAPQYADGILENVEESVLYLDSISNFQEYCSAEGSSGHRICGYKPTAEALAKTYRLFLDNGANCPLGTLPAKPQIENGVSLAGSEISSASKYKAHKILAHNFHSEATHVLFRGFADYFPQDIIVFDKSRLIIPRMIGLEDVVESLENQAYQVKNLRRGGEKREWLTAHGYFGVFFTMHEMDACEEYSKSDLEPVEVEYVYIEHDGDIVDSEKKVHGAKVERFRFNIKQYIMSKAPLLIEIFAKDNDALARRIETDIGLLSNLVYTEQRVDIARAKTLWAVGQYIMGLSFGMLIDARAIMYNADQKRDQFHIHQIQYATGFSHDEAQAIYLKKNPNNSASWGRMRFPKYRQKYFKSLMKTIRLPKPDYDQEMQDTIDFLMRGDDGFA